MDVHEAAILGQARWPTPAPASSRSWSTADCCGSASPPRPCRSSPLFLVDHLGDAGPAPMWTAAGRTSPSTWPRSLRPCSPLLLWPAGSSGPWRRAPTLTSTARCERGRPNRHGTQEPRRSSPLPQPSAVAGVFMLTCFWAAGGLSPGCRSSSTTTSRRRPESNRIVAWCPSCPTIGLMSTATGWC